MYSDGNNSFVRGGRLKDFGIKDSKEEELIVNKEMKPENSRYEYGGASSFQTRDELEKTLKVNRVWKLKVSNTELNRLGLGLKEDVSGGHCTIYPLEEMKFIEFRNKVRNKLEK